MTATRFALIENNTGFVWNVIDAETPLAACSVTDLEIGHEVRDYEQVSRFDFSSDTGYHVYEVPAGFDVDDGQDQTQIDRVETDGRLVGAFRAVAE